MYDSLNQTCSNPTATFVDCCICNNKIHSCEIPSICDGVQLRGKRWVCSRKCFEIACLGKEK